MSVDTPPPRNLGQETRDTLQAEVDLAPQQYAAEAMFRPKYAQLETDIARNTLLGTEGRPGMLDLYQNTIVPGLQSAQARANSSQRGSDIADVERLGSRAVEAIRGSNPDMQRLLHSQADEAMRGDAGNPLMAALGQDALNDLNTGAGLDPALARAVAEATRSAQGARGFGFSPADATQEAFARSGLGMQMRQQNRQNALQVYQAQQAAQEAARANKMRAIQAQAGTNVDPMMAILGRSSMAANQGFLQQGMGNSQSAGKGLFDPFNSYAQDLYNTNYNSAAAAKLASAQNSTALIGAGISAAGSIGKRML